MLYDKLWDIAVRADWRLMSVEYKALAVGAFVVAVVLIWNAIRIRKRMRRIETVENRYSKIEVALVQITDAGWRALEGLTSRRVAPRPKDQ